MNIRQASGTYRESGQEWHGTRQQKRDADSPAYLNETGPEQWMSNDRATLVSKREDGWYQGFVNDIGEGIVPATKLYDSPIYVGSAVEKVVDRGNPLMVRPGKPGGFVDYWTNGNLANNVGSYNTAVEAGAAASKALNSTTPSE